MDLEKYYKEELIDALSNIEKKYPAVYRHFFLSEIDPKMYARFLDNLGKENDSRKGNAGLDQE